MVRGAPLARPHGEGEAGWPGELRGAAGAARARRVRRARGRDERDVRAALRGARAGERGVHGARRRDGAAPSRRPSDHRGEARVGDRARAGDAAERRGGARVDDRLGGSAGGRRADVRRDRRRAVRSNDEDHRAAPRLRAAARRREDDERPLGDGPPVGGAPGADRAKEEGLAPRRVGGGAGRRRGRRHRAPAGAHEPARERHPGEPATGSRSRSPIARERAPPPLDHAGRRRGERGSTCASA